MADGMVAAMSVRELIELLQKAHPLDEVVAFNGDSGKMESVTGMLYGGRDRKVELCTDEP